MIETIRELFGRVNHSKWHCPTADDFNERAAVLCELYSIVCPDFFAVKEEAINKASRIEYCKASTLFPRGYYCPDPVEDIIVSNVKRGRIAKQRIDDPAFIYYFDSNDDLSVVIHNAITDGSRTVWNEMLFSFAGMRVGINFVDELILDRKHGCFDVNVETRNADRTEYVISSYHVYCGEWDEEVKALGAEVTRIEFAKGLPIKSIDFDERGMSDVGDETKVNFMTSTALEYDEKGFPCSMIWNGHSCKIGNIKKPNMCGMMKEK